MTVGEIAVADIAGRVVRDYLGVQPGERFAIVVDGRRRWRRCGDGRARSGSPPPPARICERR
jgi:hypothetical protein